MRIYTVLATNAVGEVRSASISRHKDFDGSEVFSVELETSNALKNESDLRRIGVGDYHEAWFMVIEFLGFMK